jgi:hypothetical protein
MEHVAHRGKRRGAYKVLVGKPEGNRALERYRRGCEDNIKMYFKVIEWGMG